MNLSATAPKLNRQRIPASPPHPHRSTRGTSRRQSTSPPFRHNPSRYAWRKPASKHIQLSGTTGPNGSGPPANRFISKRARARGAGARLKPARPKTPPAKHHPNQPAPRRRRQNAAQIHKTAPRIRRPKHPRQKAPKIKMGSGPDPDPIGSFQSDAAQLRLLFTATSMFSWQRPLFAVDILDQL